MSTLEYVKPLEFTTGQILGRATLGVIRDNDDFFNGLADRYITIPAGQVTSWQSDNINRVAWDGWHLKRTDMDTLYYYAELANDNGAEPTTLVGWYDYNDDFNDTLMFTRSATGTSSGTVDLSAFPNGLYRVTFLMSRTAGWDDATVKIRAPYTIYTGGLSYAAGTAMADASTPTAADFNKWRSNDLYFNAITPSQVAAVGMCGETTTGSNDIELFNGYDKWHPDHARLFYRVYLDEFDNDNITIYYDADDVDGIQSVSIGTEGWTVSHWDIPDGGFTKGNWYRVRVVLEPSVNAGWRYGELSYLWITAASLAAEVPYTVMDPFTVDQFVYGNTVGQGTRLQLLTDNDASIYDRLSWGAAVPGRMDHACFEPEFHGFGGGWWYGNYRMKRRGDMLYYRTLGAEIVMLGGGTQGLEDHDGTSGDYNILDLNSVNIPHGSVYIIRRASYTGLGDLAVGGGQVTDETLEFAMEL
jgi:hypothetical protein